DFERDHACAGRPTFGIGLGAQLVARALGARVYPSGVKEIGGGPVDLTGAAASTPLRPIRRCCIGTATPSIWRGAPSISPRPRCAATRAFANILCVQFHPEVDPTNG
ncbi:MAG: glutamine amidotransferase, partial [Methylocella sp.]